MSQLQVTGEAKIRDIQGPVIANSGVITALDGAASQYVRGDGTLADFPTSTGGGSSVSYYLNSSVSQGTIGGVAYRELSKEPIIGAGTDITISANGYVASYITDANDPDVLSVPGGNFNCEFYFSVNNNTGNPTTYAELYKYDGTTFTLLGSSVAVPESINQGTTIAPYYFAIPVATAALALTDRLAIRIYVSVDGRVVTLHTENSHLCQVVTTFSKGMVSLNNLTDQSQFITTGTSGTDFNIVSSGDTHTFNIPSASASNRGLITTGNQTIAGNKIFTAGVNVDNLQVVNSTLLNHQAGLSPTLVGTTAIGGSANGLFFNVNDNGRIQEFIFDTTGDRDYTFPAASGTLALTSNLSSYVPYTGATGSVDLGVYALSAGELNIKKFGTITSAINFEQATGTSIAGAGYTSIGPTGTDGVTFFFGGATNSLTFKNNLLTSSRTYSLPDASGTLALTSNLSSYVPYTGATSNVDLGTYSIGANTFSALGNGTSGGYISFTQTGTLAGISTGVASIGSVSAGQLSFFYGNNLFASIFSNTLLTATRTYTLPDASGTIALTSQLTGGTVTSVGLSSATSGVTIGSSPITTSGTITLSIATASGSQNGLLSSTDWTTFNNKQAALTNPITGTGTRTINYLPIFSGSDTTIANSAITDNGTTVTLISRALSGTSATFNGTVSSIAASGGSAFTVINSANSRAWSLIPYTNGAESDLWLYYGGTSGGTKVAFLNNGNVGIGLTNAIHTLDVNGTSRISGVLTLGSTISNGTFTYTLPSATGTLALTSQIPANPVGGTGTTNYLPKFTGASTIGNSILSESGYTLTQTSANALSVYVIKGTGSTTGLWLYTNGANATLSNQDNGSLTFETNGTTRLTIASTGAATFSSSVTATGGLISNGGAIGYGGGELGFGVTTAGATSGIYTLATASPIIYFDHRGTGNTGFFVFRNGSGGANTLLTLSATGAATFSNSVQTTDLRYTNSGYITWNTNNSGTENLIFRQDATERMRITSDGNLLIGITSGNPGQNNTSIGSNFTNGGRFFINNAGSDNIIGRNSDGIVVSWRRSGNEVGYVSLTSTTTTYNTTSDYRLKEDLKDVNGLEKLSAIKVYDYKWKSCDERMDGVLAHELAEVLPYAVSGEKDGERMQGVDYSKIVPILVKAIQELKAEIDILKNK